MASFFIANFKGGNKMAQFDINNFVIDRVIRGLMLSTDDGSVMWSVNQITNPSLSVTTESTDAVDALGTPIMTFERSKSAEFSAENSVFDLGLAAAQFGNEKQIASSTAKIITPIFEEITVTESASVSLKHAPTGSIPFIYLLNGDGTTGKRFKNGSSANATDFVHASKATTITIPTGLTAGSKLFVVYDYESEAAVAVNNTAIDFPKAGRFIMEILGADVCNSTKLVHAYVIFPNAKLMGDVDLTFTTEGTHNFSIKAQQDYCDHEKKLFSIVVPDED